MDVQESQVMDAQSSQVADAQSSQVMDVRVGQKDALPSGSSAADGGHK